jgi:hypothetical protein
MVALPCEEQEVRTERAIALIRLGNIHFSPAGRPGAWEAVNGDGHKYIVSNEGCTCPDYTERCQRFGWRCKHMEALSLYAKEVHMATKLEDLIAKLEAPFPGESVQWKPQKVFKGKGRALAVAYIDARDVMDRLDAALGSFNWQSKHESTGTGGIIAHLSIRNPETGEWVTKSDVGYVGGDESEEEQTKAAKGSASDGIKRAAVQWGIGRYLYRLDVYFVDYDEEKKKILQFPTLPDWALPESERSKTMVKKSKATAPVTNPAAAQPPTTPPERVYGDKTKVNGNVDEQKSFDTFLDIHGRPPKSVGELREYFVQVAKARSN